MLVNFRIGAHDLEIETGRHRNIPRENRKCKVCISNSVEDEYHFLLNCDFYTDIRCEYIPSKYHSIHKFNILMSSKNESIIKSIATFLVYMLLKEGDNILTMCNMFLLKNL